MKYLLLALLLCPTQLLISTEPRVAQFSTYAQSPMRNTIYRPVSLAAIAAGATAEPAVQLNSHNLSRTGPYLYTGDEPIQFFDSIRNELIAQVRLPKDSNQWLLVFVRNPNYRKGAEDQLKFLIYPFDDSPSHLPNNSLIFLNLSGRELAGLVEGKRIKLDAGESELHHAQESMPINLWSQGFNSEELLPALIKTYQFDKNHRYLMIFFPPVLKGSADLDVRVLAEKTTPDGG